MNRSVILLGLLAALGIGALSSFFIVDEREKALVMRFGRVVNVQETPGLAFKVPFVDEVVKYDDRILSLEVGPLEVTPLDDRRLVVDAFARYRITDVRRFREAVGVGNISAAESRLDNIMRDQTREVLGTVSSNDILSSDRAALMLRIRNGAITQARSLGLEVIDGLPARLQDLGASIPYVAFAITQTVEEVFELGIPILLLLAVCYHLRTPGGHEVYRTPGT